MKFSLILATLGRTWELERFLRSLPQRCPCEVEVLIVDQNRDERLAPILEQFKHASFTLYHLRTAQPGLSRARNLALPQASGDIVGFPDDDCWYPAGLLDKLAEAFAHHPACDAISGAFLDRDGQPWGVWPARRATRVTPFNLFKTTGSISMFFRRRTLAKVGLFDESLGLGAQSPWQGGEDLDYMARTVKQASIVYFDPAIYVHHDPPPQLSEAIVLKSFGYARARGRVLRKNSYPLWYLTYWSVGSLALFLATAARGQRLAARLYWLGFLGKIQGWAAPLDNMQTDIASVGSNSSPDRETGRAI
jgi:glycosyltransferase involved in cell wall biosynthesis